jgi:ATP-dependent protease ClpP protease subunit
MIKKMIALLLLGAINVTPTFARTNTAVQIPLELLLAIMPVEDNTSSDETRVLLDGPVTDDSAQEVARELIEKSNKGANKLVLVIDSPGGAVFAGAELISTMKALQATGVEIDTVCLNLCASMAAIIHQFGSTRYMQEFSVLMFHPASGGARGEIPAMISQLEAINNYVERFSKAIAARAGIPHAEFSRLEKTELWVDDEQAVKQGFAEAVKFFGRPLSRDSQKQ